MALSSDEIKKLEHQRPFFDHTKAEIQPPKYVAWIDIMGAASVLSISDVKSAIYIGKLHCAILQAKEDVSFRGNVYPFVDGCYLTTEDRSSLQKILKAIFRSLALNFIFEIENENRFMVRGSICYGNIVESSGIIDSSAIFKKNKNYVEGILFGSPLARAYEAERRAAPFGVWVDELARHFCPTNGKTIRKTFWHWWTYPTNIDKIDDHSAEIEELLAEKLHSYFEWCRRHHISIMYPKDALERHREIASQYFDNWPSD